MQTIRTVSTLKESVIRNSHNVPGETSTTIKLSATNYHSLLDCLDTLVDVKKDLRRYFYLESGRISVTGEFRQMFVQANLPHPLASESSVEEDLKSEYKHLRTKLEEFL